MELKDKTIIIAGASSGIGASAATLFAQEGANLVLGARRSGLLEQNARDITRNGGHAVFLAGDVRDADYAQELAALAVKTFGRLDGALNNAGIVGDLAPVAEMRRETWDDVIATNLTSAFNLAQAQIPALAINGGGSIVFTSSFVGYSNGGMPGMAAYAAAKSGLNGFVQSLACAHAVDGIRTHALMPGGTLTAMAGDDPDTHEFIAGLHPMKRLADPREIAQVALFLLSDRSSFMTGSPVLADGGMSVRLL